VALLATCSRRFLDCELFYPEDGGGISFETSVHTRSTRGHIPQGDILHNYRRNNLKSYLLYEGLHGVSHFWKLLLPELLILYHDITAHQYDQPNSGQIFTEGALSAWV
jgi:hypothetical protein